MSGRCVTAERGPPRSVSGGSTLVEQLSRWARERGDASGFIFVQSDGSETGSLTFSELWHGAAALAAGLAARLDPGERVLLAFAEQRNFIEAFFASQMAALVPVPAGMPRFAEGNDRLTAIVAHCEASLILTDSAGLLDGFAAVPVLTADRIRGSRTGALPPVDPDSLAFLQYTSGSTGVPKGVMVSHRNVMANQTAIAEAFRHDEDTVVAGTLPLFHDMGLVGNVLQPIFLGRPCVLIAPEAFLRRPVCWLEAISRYRVTTSGGPNALYDFCLSRISDGDVGGLDLSSWAVAFNGAEPVRAQTIEKFAARFRKAGFRRSSFLPCYGLAEATLIVSGSPAGRRPKIRKVDPAALAADCVEAPTGASLALASSGRAVDRDSLRIVASDGTRLPDERIGEIWLSSESVALGYWKEPRATSRTFGARLPGETRRYLRTGDLGFLDSRGMLFVTGRLDDLIIVSGRNLYPQDLEETASAVCPDLGRAVAYQGGSDHQRLVVLVEAKRGFGGPSSDSGSAKDALRAISRAVYRRHEVVVDEVAIVARGSLPKTTSGKLRRRAAASAWEEGRIKVVALEPSAPIGAGTEAGADLEAILSSALGIDEAALAGSLPLVSQGVDSLRAAELSALLERSGIACPPATLLVAESLDEIRLSAETPEISRPGAPPARHGAPPSSSLPLGEWQKSFWFAQQARPLSAANNVRLAVAVDEPFDADLWMTAIETVIDRHEALRASISCAPDGQPRQRFGERRDEATAIVAAEGWTDAQVEHYVTNAIDTPFDLARGPLLRCEVLRRKDGAVLILVAHHVVLDLHSAEMILTEAVGHYATLRAGRPLTPTQAPSQSAFLASAAERTARTRDADVAYWRAELAGEPEALRLPFDRSVGRDASAAGGRVLFDIDAGDVEGLRRLCLEHRATLHCALLAIYRILLYRHSGQADILIGTPVSRRRPADEELVGCLINPVVVRCRADGGSTFVEVLGRAREAMLGAMRHGDLPFHELVREVGAVRGTDGAAMVQTMFALHRPQMAGAAPLIVGGTGAGTTIGELACRGFALRRIDVPFDLSLMIVERSDGLRGCFEYRTSVLDPSTVGRLARHFRALLKQAVRRPRRAVAALQMLDGQDRRELDRAQRGHRDLAPIAWTVPDLINRQAARTPEAPALRWNGETLSYRALRDAALSLAGALRHTGCRPGHRYVVAMTPSAAWVETVIAIWYAGATVVSVDPDVPPQRLRDIIADSDPQAVLCEGIPSPALTEAAGDLLRSLSDLAAPAAGIAAADSIPTAPGSIAYLAFTSGSSGRPKGVMITHQAAANFALAQAELLGREALQRVLQLTPASFDAVYSDLMMTLGGGGTLCIAAGEARLPGHALSQFIAEERITLITATPSMLAELDPAVCSELVAMISVGEICTTQAAQRWWRSCAFYNGYGPTEATIGASLGRFCGESGAGSHNSLDVGHPLANYDMFVLDDDLNLLPRGAAGEIYIGGSGLALGYAKRPDLTADRFVPNPYGAPGERLYRTGDRGRWLADARLQFLGRFDRQLKRRGVRIEPAEIEAVLRTHPAVDDCFVAVADAPNDTVQLVAYVTGRKPEDDAGLIDQLRRHFPPFMMPGRFVWVPALPTGATGKIDISSLAKAAPRANPASPFSALEAQLGEAWREVLATDEIGVDDNFFDIGGHSLLLHKLQIEVERRTGRTVALLDFFDYPTIRALARNMRPPAANPDPDPRSLTLPAPGDQMPIAVIGLAGRFPGGPDIEAFWRTIATGRDTIRFFSPAELADAGVETGGSFVPARGVIEGIKDFDAAFFGFSPREAEILDPQKRILLELAQAAFDDAGHAPADDAMRNNVGTFVGTGRNSYFASNVAGHSEILDALGPIKVGIASDPSFAASLIAYKLNFSGPCVAIDTACSTSLVAVHQACRSLWAGECEVALAGGTSIDVPVAGGHSFEEGMIASPDGRCRAYDELAAGTVKGMGGGLVVLKPLALAQRDANHVYAVIRGSAVNNDGSHKIGFTAPSPRGQEQVIRRALEVAGVSPASVGYIEGHGTGTALGDPIEVTALNRAFCDAPPETIALGSVKSNIGHLDAAAGIAGLIKAVLVVSRGLIPPQVHAARPNSRIEWREGPFYLPTRIQEWPADKRPRRAGVSAFGIGGTNAHVVLEEAPPRAAKGKANGPWLIPISAGSPAGLRATAARLATALRAGDAEMGDVAFTLAVGRRPLRCRASFMADDAGSLADQLAGDGWDAVESDSCPRLVCHFPDRADAGSLSSARSMAHSTPAFAAALRTCLDHCISDSGWEIARLLKDDGETALRGPPVSRVAAFAIGYAHHIFASSAGLAAEALMGRGVGELTALCVAGGIALRDTVELAGEWDSLAAGGCPRTRRVVAALKPGDKEMAALALAERCDGIERRELEIAVFSAATGRRLIALDRTYWMQLFGGSDRYADAAAAACGSGPAISVSLGSGVRNAPGLGPSFAMAADGRQGNTRAGVLETLGRLWGSGLPVDIASLVAGGRRISLPGVVLERRRLWLEPVRAELSSDRSAGVGQPDGAAPREIGAALWRKFLGIATVDPEDDFFAFGGDSLLAIEFLGELGEALGVKLPPNLMHEQTCFGALCAHLDALPNNAPPPLSPPAPARDSARGARVPLSAFQQGIWLAEQLERAGASMNLTVCLRFERPPNGEILERALRTILDRHPILLNNFDTDADLPFQWRAHEPAELNIQARDMPEEAWSEAIQRQAEKPFDIAAELLLRATILCDRAGRQLLVITAHHLIADGRSLVVLLEELAGNYAEPSLWRPPAPSYLDILARSQRAPAVSEARRVGSSLGGTTTAKRPPERPLPNLGGTAAASPKVRLGTQLSGALRTACREQGITLFSFMLAAFQLLISQAEAAEEVIIASPISKRSGPGEQDVIGPFIELEMFRTTVGQSSTFLDIARAAKTGVASALRQDGKLRGTDMAAPGHAAGVSPFRIAMALNHALPAEVAFGPEISAQPFLAERKQARHPLMLWIDDEQTDICCTLEYRTAHYDEGTIDRYLNGYRRILTRAAREPGALPADFGAYSEDAEKIAGWNATDAARPFASVQLGIAQTARDSSDAIAILAAERSLTFGALDAEARRVARLLLDRGIRTEEPVGILLGRGPESVIAAVAVLYAGACFVPLDPALPPIRIRQMIDAAGIACVITDSEGCAHAAMPGMAPICWTDSPCGGHEAVQLPQAIQRRNLAYIMFTSGTTGLPKGVMVDHQGLANRLHWMIEAFQIGREDRILHKTPLGFDVSVWELLIPPLVGAVMVIAPPGAERDAARLGRMIVDHEVTIAHFVPSMMRAFLEQHLLPRRPPLRLCLFSGEALGPDVLERARAWLGDGCTIANLYGPTEASIDVTAWIEDGKGRRAVVPIGRPIDNIRIHIVDADLRPVAIGVTGDVLIAGAGLARGYIGAPELTADHFLPNPFGAGGERLYRTGDRGRWTTDGQIEFQGRADAQIKLRGVRIEPAEIEATMVASALVEAAVISVRGRDGDERLIAHAIPSRALFADLRAALGARREISPGVDDTPFVDAAATQYSAAAGRLKKELKAVLAARLPEAMVPHEIVLIGDMPVTANGKRDLKKLAELGRDPWGTAGSGPEPGSDMVARVARLWQQAIGGAYPSADEHFFRSGGNSLSAVRLLAGIWRHFGLSLDFKSLLENPTPAGIAALLDGLPAPPGQSSLVAEPSCRFEPFPMTPLQQAYAIGRSAAFHLGDTSTQGYIEIAAGDIDRDRLTAALNKLIERHDMLRAIECGPAMLRVLDTVHRIEPTFSDLRSLPPAEAEAEVERIREEMLKMVFDPRDWPMFEVRLTRLGNDRNVIHLCIDALIVDGASALLLERELNRLYWDGDTPAVPPGLTFRDVATARARHRAGESYAAARAYWLDRLAGLPEAPRLPVRNMARAGSSPRFARRHAKLTSQDWQALRSRAREMGVTPVSLLLAAYAEVLALWSGDDHFLINLPINGRNDAHPDVAEIVGNLSSTILLEVDLREADSFNRIAADIHRQLWTDLAHANFDGVELQRHRSRLERSLTQGRNNIVFTGLLGLAPEDDRPSDATFDLRRELFGVSRTSQVTLDCIVIEQGDGLTVSWDHVADVFPEGLIDDMFDAFLARLLAIGADEGCAGRRLDPGPPRWRAAAVAIDSRGYESSTLIDLFRAAAARHPRSPAVVSGPTELTYQQVSDLAGGVAAELRGLGIGRGDVVAVHADKGWEQLVAALGIMAAGGAYVPVDTNLPAERRRRILERSGAGIAIAQPGTADEAASAVARVVTISRDGPSGEWPENLPGCGDLAYVIFTSGSTGAPKGVAIEHGAAANTLADINARFGVSRDDAVLAVSELGFDLSVYDMFGLLAAGGRIVFPDAERPLDARHWADLIARHRVTIWNSAPQLASHFIAALEAAPGDPSSLRLFLLSGDWIPLDLPDRLRTYAEDSLVVGLGGATEAAIWSVFHRVETIAPDWRSIPYGRPLSGQDVVVLDRSLRHCPTWVTGEIHIAGHGLARGYWREPELTAHAFAEHSHWHVRLYRTGDLGRYRPDGEIEFLGRRDDQVKLQGHRFELGEVESAIEAHRGVDRAVVTGEYDGDGKIQRLIAFVSLNEGAVAEGASRRLGVAPGAREAIWSAIIGPQDWLVADEPAVDSGIVASQIEQLETCYRDALALLFGTLSPSTASTSVVSVASLIDEHRIAPRYRRWLSRALSYLHAHDCLEQVSADGYRILPILSRLAADGVDEGLRLDQVLREEIHSAQIYAQETTESGYQAYYRGCHALAKAVIERLGAASASGGLNILEVGAGYGSLTRHLLPALPGDSRYLFTDISPFFLEAARAELGGVETIRFEIYDIDVEPQVQAMERHSFDAIIAASVLHNARDLPSALAHLRSLLAPAGILLLIEETRFHPFFDLGMGLQQGFDDYEDALRGPHPLLSRKEWQAALAGAGFAASAVAARPGTAEDALGFDVLIAQAPDSATIVDADALARHVERLLPRAAIPAKWLEVDHFPLKNGKISRKDLPRPSLRSTICASAYVEPRSETEKTVAEIWCKALGLPAVGVADNFLDIGGDSLIASRVISEVRERMGIDIRLQALFERATIGSLSELIDVTRSQAAIPTGGVVEEL